MAVVALLSATRPHPPMRARRSSAVTTALTAPAAAHASRSAPRRFRFCCVCRPRIH